MKFSTVTLSSSLLLLLPFLPFLPTAHSWGSLGHETVAYIASNLVSPSTTRYFQSILHNDTDHYLAAVATWADSFRYTAAGNFSAPLHYIDAEDEPPRKCGVKMERDCARDGGAGCIVGAIANYTRQLLDEGLNPWQKSMAAKFIVHFVGDIHQPLHTEHLSRGGNSISVNFTGSITNLHHVWDTSIPEKLIGGYSLTDAERWAAMLTDSIKSGMYKSLVEGWVKGMDLRDPISTALSWAEESNRLVCEVVLRNGVEGVEGKELSGLYYEVGLVVVQQQIARAGVRLAAWLDLIAEGTNTEL